MDSFWLLFGCTIVALVGVVVLLVLLLLRVRQQRRRVRASAVKLEAAFATTLAHLSSTRHGVLGYLGGGRCCPERCQRRFAARPSRWATLVACLWAATMSGLLYTFAVYSSALKRRFALSQAQLAMVFAVPQLAQLFAFVPGLVNDLCGARFTLLVGGSASAVAYLAMWLIARAALSAPTPAAPHGANGTAALGNALAPLYASPSRVAAVLTVVNSAAALGASFVSAAVFATLVRAFPRRSAAAAGLVHGWVGLGGGVATQLFAGWVADPDASARTLDFLLLLAVGCAVATLCALPGMAAEGAERSGGASAVYPFAFAFTAAGEEGGWDGAERDPLWGKVRPSCAQTTSTVTFTFPFTFRASPSHTL